MIWHFPARVCRWEVLFSYGRPRRRMVMRSRNVFLVGAVMAAVMLAAAPASETRAQDFDVNIIKTGLNQPVGIAASALGDSDTLYFTEIPQAGAEGLGTNGANTISKLT